VNLTGSAGALQPPAENGDTRPPCGGAPCPPCGSPCGGAHRAPCPPCGGARRAGVRVVGCPQAVDKVGRVIHRTYPQVVDKVIHRLSTGLSTGRGCLGARGFHRRRFHLPTLYGVPTVYLPAYGAVCPRTARAHSVRVHPAEPCERRAQVDTASNATIRTFVDRESPAPRFAASRQRGYDGRPAPVGAGGSVGHRSVS
jgi:hypothetical protein